MCAIVLTWSFLYTLLDELNVTVYSVDDVFTKVFGFGKEFGDGRVVLKSKVLDGKVKIVRSYAMVDVKSI